MGLHAKPVFTVLFVVACCFYIGALFVQRITAIITTYSYHHSSDKERRDTTIRFAKHVVTSTVPPPFVVRVASVATKQRENKSRMHCQTSRIRPPPFRLWFGWWLLLLLPCCCNGAPGTYYFFCQVSIETEVTLVWNATTGLYEPQQQQQQQQEDDNIRRHAMMAWQDAEKVWLPNNDALDVKRDDDSTAVAFSEPSSSTKTIMEPWTRRHLQITTTTDDNTSTDNTTTAFPPPRQGATMIQARLCPCSENPAYATTAYYCATDKTYCAVPANYYQHAQSPLCLDLQSDEIFARSIWPVIVIWFCLSALFCACTAPGRHAMAYLLSTVWPRWNERVVDRWLLQRTPPARAAQALWRRHVQRQRRASPQNYSGAAGYMNWRNGTLLGMNNRDNNNKVEFVLKTCLYRAPFSAESRETTTSRHDDEQPGNTHNSNDDEDQRVTCSICFIPLEEGVKIGKLQCGHLFHSECIKGWIQRRNACPLCLDENIAVPRHVDEATTRVETAPWQESQASSLVVQPEAFL